jgi:hypothetical protein
MSSFLLHCSELSAPCISGCKPRHRRLILRGPMALKEAFAPGSGRARFSAPRRRTSRSTPESLLSTSSDLVAINNVLRRTKWSLLRIP